MSALAAQAKLDADALMELNSGFSTLGDAAPATRAPPISALPKS